MNEIYKFKNGIYFIEHCHELEQLKAENEELKEKLEKIKEVINCDDYGKEHCIYCTEAHHCYTKQVLEIIESEE